MVGVVPFSSAKEGSCDDARGLELLGEFGQKTALAVILLQDLKVLGELWKNMVRAGAVILLQDLEVLTDPVESLLIIVLKCSFPGRPNCSLFLRNRCPHVLLL